MSQIASATAFVNALKEAGITVQNEAVLVSELDASTDQNLTLEKLCLRGNDKNVSFIADLNGDAKLLSKAFVTHGFDGFTYRTFINSLKTEA